MMNINLDTHGCLEKRSDNFEGYGLQTDIGPVNVQIVGLDFPVPDMQKKIQTVLSKLADIDGQAREYLRSKAGDEVERAGGLVEPSLLFVAECGMGDFTMFYSGSREDDETCYGVEFRNFKAFDLTIGD